MLIGVRPERPKSPRGSDVSNEHLTLQDSDAVATALEHYRKRPALGYSDCLILEVARKAGHLPLGTFDSHLGKLDGAEKL